VSAIRFDDAALAALVQDDRIHRDLYLSRDIFDLEMTRLWARAWLFVGHESQVPQPGDYTSLDLAGQPVILVRHDDAGVRVLMNRCAHKGAKVVSAPSGNTGRFFRCPYHAWAYHTDGAPYAVPRSQGYDGTRMRECESGRGLVALRSVHVHRGFVFARLADEGPRFADSAGEWLAALDNLVDRSPDGTLEVAGGVLRTTVRANWKIYLENVNDAVHPVSTHESAAVAATKVWAREPADRPKPMAMQQLLPFGTGYDAFEQMGGRVLPGGHSILGTRTSLHGSYVDLPGYEAAMIARHGTGHARGVLSFTPQNAVLYPGLSIKTAPPAIRVLRPIAPDRTVVEAWSFRPHGAPDGLLARATLYNRLVFSPMSVVAHDDLHIFESIHAALRTSGNPWISLHRNHAGDDDGAVPRDVGGTDEALLRNQYRAWQAGMMP